MSELETRLTVSEMVEWSEWFRLKAERMKDAAAVSELEELS